MQDGTLNPLGNLLETIRDAGHDRPCPTRQLLDRVGDKWSVLILLFLAEQETRFGRLKQLMNGISQKMLSHTLRSLERDGLVTRHAIATVPVTVSYRITAIGEELLVALRAMVDWAETRKPEVLDAQRRYDRRRSVADPATAMTG